VISSHVVEKRVDLHWIEQWLLKAFCPFQSMASSGDVGEINMLLWSTLKSSLPPAVCHVPSISCLHTEVHVLLKKRGLCVPHWCSDGSGVALVPCTASSQRWFHPSYHRSRVSQQWRTPNNSVCVGDQNIPSLWDAYVLTRIPWDSAV